MDIKDADNVEIKECRPLSKTKRFVITKKLYDVKKKITLESKEGTPTKKRIKKQIKKKK